MQCREEERDTEGGEGDVECETKRDRGRKELIKRKKERK